VTSRQTRTNIKNLSGQNLDIASEYHNSPLAFWLHAYRQRRLISKYTIFATFRPSSGHTHTIM